MRKILPFIVVLISTLLMFGCAKAEIDSPSIPNGIAENNPDQTAIIGKQQPNPYAVDTMRKAYRNLAVTTRSLAPESEITPTHLYVKFTPRNIDELNVILAETQLELYLFPLDRESSSGWSSVIPGFSTNEIQNRWCSVPVEHKLPEGCPYEILEELYIPDEYDVEERNITRAASLPESFIIALVAESMRLCGMEEDAEMVTRAIYRIPSGRILAWDDTRKQHVGNEGMKVRATRLFKTAVGFCDSNGYFVCDKSFSEAWDYNMHFGRNDFELREDNTTEIVYKYHKARYPWNYTFAAGSKESFWSTAFRAAFYYYYKNIDGLSRPPLNSFWKARVSIRVNTGYDPEGNAQGYMRPRPKFLGIGHHIMIYKQYLNKTAAGKTEIKECATDYLYYTALHELAHTAHWGWDRSNFNDSDDIVLESWAVGAGRFLARKVYPTFEVSGQRCMYTNIIRDLTDGYKSTTSARYWSGSEDIYLNRSYVDNVQGYTIAEIESAIKGQKNWTAWKNNIKSKYPTKTDRNYVDALFNHWNTK